MVGIESFLRRLEDTLPFSFYMRPLIWDRRLATTFARFSITFTPILRSLWIR